jgi:hypothetical protein
MSTVTQIEQAVRELPPSELVAFRAWFAGFDAEDWDRQFDDDVFAGRLDRVGDEALADHRAGRCTDL